MSPIELSDRVITPDGHIGTVTRSSYSSAHGEKFWVEWIEEDTNELVSRPYYDWQLTVQPELPFENAVYKWLGDE